MDRPTVRRRKSKPRATIHHLARWTKLSRWYRTIKPVCQKCRQAPSEHVHHIVPVSQRPDMAFWPENLIAICKECHSEEHK